MLLNTRPILKSDDDEDCRFRFLKSRNLNLNLKMAVPLNTRPILRSDDEDASIRFTRITRSTRIAKSIYLLKGRFVNAMVQSVKMQNLHNLNKCARLAVSLNSLCRGLCVTKRMEFWKGSQRLQSCISVCIILIGHFCMVVPCMHA